MDFPNLVWSEREAGDWEACVVTSYAMGLLHGGVPMAAAYTQAEREKLEKVKDEPQDFNTTDAMSQAVYGHTLRRFTTGSVADAVKRVNVGIVLVGIGSPGRQWEPGFAGMHAVFYVPTSANSGYLGDPLAPNRQPFELIKSSTIVAWAKAPGPNAAREVKRNEFVPPPPPKMYTQQQLDDAVDKAAHAVAAAAVTEAGKQKGGGTL